MTANELLQQLLKIRENHHVRIQHAQAVSVAMKEIQNKVAQLFVNQSPNQLAQIQNRLQILANDLSHHTDVDLRDEAWPVVKKFMESDT